MTGFGVGLVFSVGIAAIVAISNDSFPYTFSALVSPDGTRIVDVDLVSGKNRLQTTGLVQIEELLGTDQFASSDCSITTVTVTTGDTIRTIISPDSIDVTTTAVGGDTPFLLVKQHVVDLKADAGFVALYTATQVKNNSIYVVQAKIRAEAGERLTAGDFDCLGTGTIADPGEVQPGFDIIEARGKATSLSADPDDPRVGVLGISGQFAFLPGTVSDLFIEEALSGGDPDMTIDGSATPVIFTVASTTKQVIVRQIKCFGNDNGIKFGQFLGINSPLTNGIKIEIKSQDNIIILPTIFSTEDWKHKFALGGGVFQLDIQAGRDDFAAEFDFDPPFIMEPTGTFSPDDSLKITIRDNLTSVISLECIAVGFEREV